MSMLHIFKYLPEQNVFRIKTVDKNKLFYIQYI